MERLTFEGNFCDIAQCREMPCPYKNACSQKQVWERLKAYEDSPLSPDICVEYKKFEDEIVSKGLTIARIVELMNADADGRIVILAEKPQPKHPCIRCDTGWGSASPNGVHTCEETCERLKAYREVTAHGNQ